MYNSEHEHPGYRVFHDVFDVKLQKLFTYDEDEKSFYTTRDTSYDTELEYELVSTVRTVYQLAKLSERGAQIILKRPTDSIQIYNLIMEYSRVWTEAIQARGIVQEISIYMETDEFKQQQQDIELLQTFAQEIQPHAQTQLPNDLRVNSAMGRFRLLQEKLGKISPTTVPKTVLPADSPTPIVESACADLIRKRSRMW